METTFMERRKRSRYVVGIALNGGISLLILLIIVFVALPKYDELSAQADLINTMNSEISALKTNGVDAAKFESLLRESGRRKEISDDVFADRARLQSVLAKPANAGSDYIAWTTSEAGRIESIDAEIERNDRILGNIIPHYTPSVGNGDENIVKHQVTLANFIAYVEKDILAKYHLSSYAPIGMENITFDSKKTSTVNIGSFRLTLDFTGKNSDIYRFIDAIQTSGTLTIRDGKLVAGDTSTDREKNDQYSDLSNLLITIPALSFFRDLEQNNEQNSGTITLEFYVEGMNYQKVLLLRSALANRFDTLKKNIRATADMCIKAVGPVCQEGSGNSAVSAIRSLSRSVGELQQSVDTLRRGSVITDISAELDSLLALQSSIDGMERTYERNMTTIKKIQDRTNKKK